MEFDYTGCVKNSNMKILSGRLLGAGPFAKLPFDHELTLLGQGRTWGYFPGEGVLTMINYG